MKDYHVFGGRLRSAVDFVDLPRATSDGNPNWRLELASPPLAAARGPELGREKVQQGVEVRLHRDGQGLYLAYDDSGVFHISGDGGLITWSPGEKADPEAVRMDVLGRVLPVALHLQGHLVLHASAVVVDEARAVGFVGSKRAGKSTLALALHREGARVLTDDVLVLDVGAGTVLARPGVADLRLRRDAASAARLEDSGAGSVGNGGRTLLRVRQDGEGRSVPLTALYLLDPPSAESPVENVVIRDLSGTRAAAALVGQTKAGSLLAAWDAPGLLDRASTLVRHVPVRVLRLPRGLDRLRESASYLIEAVRGGPGDEGASAT